LRDPLCVAFCAAVSLCGRPLFVSPHDTFRNSSLRGAKRQSNPASARAALDCFAYARNDEEND
jgi:hypothetical protein